MNIVCVLFFVVYVYVAQCRKVKSITVKVYMCKYTNWFYLATVSHIDLYDEEQDMDDVHLHVETWNTWYETNEQGEPRREKAYV